MNSLTIELSEEQMRRLNETATGTGVGVEELVRRSVDEYLERRRVFREAADYVLNKNAELYRRLA
jgi:predicted transcriptional regulator